MPKREKSKHQPAATQARWLRITVDELDIMVAGSYEQRKGTRDRVVKRRVKHGGE
jgi:hypothetical protein